MEIIELSTRKALHNKAVKYFYECWGNETNFKFYEDCILHSVNDINSLPKFYIMLSGDNIIGAYALLTNDIISRQDLMPWLACLFVNTEYRNKGLAKMMLEHGKEQSLKMAFRRLYLNSDLIGFYEKYGWEFLGIGYDIAGNETKIYEK